MIPQRVKKTQSYKCQFRIVATLWREKEGLLSNEIKAEMMLEIK